MGLAAAIESSLTIDHIDDILDDMALICGNFSNSNERNKNRCTLNVITNERVNMENVNTDFSL